MIWKQVVVSIGITISVIFFLLGSIIYVMDFVIPDLEEIRSCSQTQSFRSCVYREMFPPPLPPIPYING